MDATQFRKELVKIMPGFDWTVHKTSKGFTYISATGIQTSGFNRLATLQVVWRERNGVPEYEVKSSGYGKKTPWLSEATRGTLAQALRALQDHYQCMASTYGSQAITLQHARMSSKNYGSAITEIMVERRRQDVKWGGPEHDDAHATTHFLNFIQARVKAAHTQGATPAARANLIEIAALAVAAQDGRYAVEGCVHSIERNEYAGKPIVYPTREQAIRVAAARMIRTMRKARTWDRQYGGMQGKQLAEVINWARSVVAKETGKPMPSPVHIKDPPPPFRETGLSLFDFARTPVPSAAAQ